MNEPHLADGRLAAIADGDPANGVEELHLAQCRACAAVHAELVQLRVTGIVGRPAEVPVEILAAGHQFVEGKGGVQHEPRRRSGISPWRRGALRIAPALAAVAVLLVLVGRWSSPDVELPPASRFELVKKSTEQGQVHPLVLAERAIETVSERGGSPSSAAEQELEIARDGDGEEAVVAIAARVAVLQASPGNHKLAGDILRQATIEHPDTEVLRQLHLYQLALEGSYPDLQSRLESRVESDPDDYLARLNLAIIYAEFGDPESIARARDLVRDLPRDGDSVFAYRVRRILGQ